MYSVDVRTRFAFSDIKIVKIAAGKKFASKIDRRYDDEGRKKKFNFHTASLV